MSWVQAPLVPPEWIFPRLSRPLGRPFAWRYVKSFYFDLYATAYEIGGILNKHTGRAKPIICDFCKTWQPGGRSGSITFCVERRSLSSVTFLCCLDLKCSLHVRDMTESAKSSRVQLREDVSQDYRVERLRGNLSALVKRLNLRSLVAVSSMPLALAW